MSDNQNDVLNYNEFDFNELIITLWKNKIMIVCFTVITAIIAGLFSILVLSPVYDTRLNIVISMPESYKTKYGEYKPPISTNQQFINLITSNNVLGNTIKDMKYTSKDMTVEKLRESISIGKTETAPNIIQNSYEVTVSADNPEKSLKIAEMLFHNYVEFLDVMLKERAIAKFTDDLTMSIKTMKAGLDKNKVLLAKNKEILANTPQTINQKEAMNAIKSQLTNTSEYVVLENIINPNYTKIEGDILDNEQVINQLEDSINTSEKFLKELDIEKNAISSYYISEKGESDDSDLIGNIQTSVYLPSPPIAPVSKTSPSYSLNVLIGVVFGFILGIMATLIRKYLIKEEAAQTSSINQ